MDTYIKSFVYPAVFTILGGFGLVYISVLLQTARPYSIDTLLRHIASAFFIIVFLGAIICWLLDCPFPFGLPTFGLENQARVIG
jgi:hypothetical protein